MDIFTFDKVTAAIILDTRRAKTNSKKKGEKYYPVKYRVGYLRKYTYYPSGRSLSKNEFVLLDDPSKMKEERKLISAGFEKIKEHIKELVKGEGFSQQLLAKRLSRGTKDSIYDAYQYKIEQAKTLNTADWYRYSKKALEGFAGSELKYNQVTKIFLERFEKHLLDNSKTYSSISIYMRALMSVINEGKRQGIINQAQYPFGKGKYEIPLEAKRKIALTIAQVKQIVNYPLIKEIDRQCRDLWVFIYLASGINITDLLNLRYKNIRNGKLYYYRQKTIHSKVKKEIVIYLQPKMKEIIETWGNPEKPESFIFPVLSDNLTAEESRRRVKNMTHLMNDKMTAIGEALGIGKISTYTGRHSYATIQKRAGTSIEFISEQLGHADVGITETYLDSFEDDEMRKNAEKLLSFD